jgi:hypothetical protein
MSDEEWHVPKPETPLRQGDILMRRDPKRGTIKSLCLIITADCDISQRKFGTQLGCLRIISFQEYLRTPWAEKKLVRALEKETAAMQVQLNKWNSQRLTDAKPLSTEAVVNWIRRSKSESICQALKVPAMEIAKISAKIDAFRTALNDLDEKSESDSFSRLIAFRSPLSGKTHSVCAQEAIQQAKGEELPDDIFLLPALPQVDIGCAVVLLREIVGVGANSIRFRAIDADSEDVFFRIGGLLPTFQYAVSQAFGSLYSRIGLPEAYELRRKTAIQLIHTYKWD